MRFFKTRVAKWFLILSVGSGFVAFCGIRLFTTDARTPASLAADYIQAKRGDEWWLTRTPTSFSDEDILRLRFRHRAILAALSRFRDVSPRTQKLAELLPRIVPMVSIAGGSAECSLSGEKNSLLSAGAIEFCYIPRDLVGEHAYRFYCRQDWPAVVAVALDYPQLVAAALFFHELGHLASNFDWHGSTSQVELNPQMLREEVGLYELETLIFDAGTNGLFSRFLDEVLARKSISGGREAILALTPADMRYLDQLLAASDSGHLLGAILAFHYQMAIGLRYLRNVKVSDFDRKVSALYLWIAGEDSGC
mgnify:CR=1 FL=1